LFHLIRGKVQTLLYNHHSNGVLASDKRLRSHTELNKDVEWYCQNGTVRRWTFRRI